MEPNGALIFQREVKGIKKTINYFGPKIENIKIGDNGHKYKGHKESDTIIYWLRIQGEFITQFYEKGKKKGKKKPHYEYVEIRDALEKYFSGCNIDVTFIGLDKMIVSFKNTIQMGIVKCEGYDDTVGEFTLYYSLERYYHHPDGINKYFVEHGTQLQTFAVNHIERDEVIFSWPSKKHPNVFVYHEPEPGETSPWYWDINLEHQKVDCYDTTLTQPTKQKILVFQKLSGTEDEMNVNPVQLFEKSETMKANLFFTLKPDYSTNEVVFKSNDDEEWYDISKAITIEKLIDTIKIEPVNNARHIRTKDDKVRVNTKLNDRVFNSLLDSNAPSPLDPKKVGSADERERKMRPWLYDRNLHIDNKYLHESEIIENSYSFYSSQKWVIPSFLVGLSLLYYVFHKIFKMTLPHHNFEIGNEETEDISDKQNEEESE